MRNKLCLRMLILSLFFSQRTPLHISASLGNLEVCRLLLQSNADLQAQDMR
jgi:ankyrin repeat protein